MSELDPNSGKTGLSEGVQPLWNRRDQLPGMCTMPKIILALLMHTSDACACASPLRNYNVRSKNYLGTLKASKKQTFHLLLCDSGIRTAPTSKTEMLEW